MALIFTDTNPLTTVGDFCSVQAPGRVACQNASSNVEAHLRDGNDRARVSVSSVAKVWGGAGDDFLTGDSFGQWTELYGESGDDDVWAGGEGGQIADGGRGDDVVRAGGFAGQASGFGGPGADTLFFASGRGGAATLDAGTGDDTVAIQPGNPGTATGGPGDDTLAITDQLPPQFPADGFELSGGAGRDTLTGGAFEQRVDGGSGDDTIDVRDGGDDTVTCGDGQDVVQHDAGDTIAADCETTLLAP
ncbi:MAG: calcium-binding protein [Solirubrobacteraceae bacterium]